MHESDAPNRKPTPDEFIPIGTEDQALDLVTLAKRSIRGRVPLTLIIAGSLGLIFALIGYTRTGLEYQSRVTVFVRENIQTVTGDQIDIEGRFTDYVERKAEEFRSNEVLLFAADDADLQGIGWPGAERGATRLRETITTEFKRNKSFFTATSTTNDPRTAREALVSVVEAFMKYEESKNSIAAQENELNQLIRDHETNIQGLRNSIQLSTEQYGTTDLSQLIRVLEEDRGLVQKQIEDLQAEIQQREQQAPLDRPETVDPSQLRPEQMAAQDGELANLIRQRDQIRAQIEILIETKGSRYPEIDLLRSQEQVYNLQIERRAELVRGLIEEGKATVDPAALSLQGLYDTLALKISLRSTRDEKLKELRGVNENISKDQSSLERLVRTRDELEDQRAELRLNQRRRQEGRIEIVSPPSAAAQAPDKRPLLAGMGFVAGAFMGVAGVVALGSMKRQFRYVDDLETIRSLPPLLGTLPELEKHDPDNERIAAVSVHNLRNTLQAIQGYGDNTSVVIACTSAEPGDGKTTLIQSLGASYALTGLRTILVDMDLIGGGLSARLGLTGRRGVADLLTGLEPTKCIKHTQTDKLYAMPIGDTTKCRPEQLASRPIQQVIDWLRERFDVILMDTGPVLGSLEAGIVTAAADQVLLVVARGQADAVVQAAVSRLERLGVRSTGLVFNRADPEDLRRSLSAASVGAPSMHQMPRRQGERSLDMDRSIVGSIPPPKPERVGTLDAAEDETGT